METGRSQLYGIYGTHARPGTGINAIYGLLLLSTSSTSFAFHHCNGLELLIVEAHSTFPRVSSILYS